MQDSGGLFFLLLLKVWKAQLIQTEGFYMRRNCNKTNMQHALSPSLVNTALFVFDPTLREKTNAIIVSSQ